MYHERVMQLADISGLNPGSCGFDSHRAYQKFGPVAELADALGSGPGGGNFVEVRILSGPPYSRWEVDISERLITVSKSV